MTQTLQIILFAALIALAAPLSARADTSGLDFLTGAWIGGRGDNLTLQYDWKAPAGGVSMATYFVPDTEGKFRFAELILVEDTPDGTLLRLSHFNKDYTTWEEDGPLVLTLTEQTKNSAKFVRRDATEGLEYLHYKRSGDTLSIDIKFFGRDLVTNTFNPR